MAVNEKPGYQFLFQRLPIMVAAVDELGFFIDQSDAMINRLGYSREELRSLRPTDIADEDSVRRINEEFIPQLRRTGSVRDVPVVFLDRNGEAVRLMTSADVERDAAGVYLRTLAIYRDMDEAAELEARYAAMYRATPAMLHIVDQKGRITDVSDRWLTKLGFERKDVLGKSILGFLSEDNRRAIGGQERLENLIASGGVTNSERKMVTRAGRTLELMMSTLAERNAAGQAVRMLVASKDVTERNEAERALRRAFEENARLREELEAERDYLREEFNESLRFGEVVGSSPALRQMLARVEAVAATPASVLILGESGTGKELVARELHARSPRNGASLV